MSKRSSFTIITPLPPSANREMALELLHSHTDMIDLNPLVEERHQIKPPPNATPEEYHCIWYSLVDRVQYLPGGIMSKKISYTVCFHDLANGLQEHYYAPYGLNIKNKWTICGSLPGEAIAPVEIGVGAPVTGLYLREDVKMTCNFMATSFVKKTLRKAHALLLSRLVARVQFLNVRRKSTPHESVLDKFQQDYEPIEFGRDGQITETVPVEQNILKPRAPSLLLSNPPRPLSAYYESDNKNHPFSPNLSTSSFPRNSSFESERADSSSSPLAPRSLWQSLKTPSSSPWLETINPQCQNIVFELEAHVPVSANDEKSQIYEMDSGTEIKKDPLKEYDQRPQSLCKPIIMEPVELEGSFQM